MAELICEIAEDERREKELADQLNAVNERILEGVLRGNEDAANEYMRRVGVAFCAGQPVPKIQEAPKVYIFAGCLPDTMRGTLGVFGHVIRAETFKPIVTVTLTEQMGCYSGQGVINYDAQLPAWGGLCLRR